MGKAEDIASTTDQCIGFTFEKELKTDLELKVLEKEQKKKVKKKQTELQALVKKLKQKQKALQGLQKKKDNNKSTEKDNNKMEGLQKALEHREVHLKLEIVTLLETFEKTELLQLHKKIEPLKIDILKKEEERRTMNDEGEKLVDLEQKKIDKKLKELKELEEAEVQLLQGKIDILEGEIKTLGLKVSQKADKDEDSHVRSKALEKQTGPDKAELAEKKKELTQLDKLKKLKEDLKELDNNKDKETWTYKKELKEEVIELIMVKLRELQNQQKILGKSESEKEELVKLRLKIKDLTDTKPVGRQSKDEDGGEDGESKCLKRALEDKTVSQLEVIAAKAGVETDKVISLVQLWSVISDKAMELHKELGLTELQQQIDSTTVVHFISGQKKLEEQKVYDMKWQTYTQTGRQICRHTQFV